MNIKATLSHNTDEYKTPSKIYEWYIKAGYYDPCPINHKKNGLEIEWKEFNFVNPPYSQLKKWVEKAITEHKKGKSIIMLIPARTDTKAFKLLYEYGATFTFITGRLHFNDSKNPAPFPSMFVNITGSESLFYLKDKE